MIALNLATRFFAILLIFFVAAATFYFHDFWNQSPPENAKSLMDALKNLSIIGALFIIAGYGRGPRLVRRRAGSSTTTLAMPSMAKSSEKGIRAKQSESSGLWIRRLRSQ